ncbi:alpha-hydroxy acid oxidase [Novosphingobium pentaromativorans]|nr:alpha-hydroxy acid oxidase [Novosphingobium pentaromativorans]AIT82135.1 hypothetical protein JI59_21645 [Novosphingobium pentaromativorans US6-1]
MAAIDRAYNVADIAAIARRRLPPGLYDFIDRGAEDEVTRRENSESIKRILIRQRVGIDTSMRDITTQIGSVVQSMPIGLAVTGMVGLLHYKGEQAMASAAASAGVPYTLGSGNFAGMAECKEICGDLLWRQLYPCRTEALLQHHLGIARDAGVNNLVITLDSPQTGNREYMLRNGFMPGMLNRNAIREMLSRPGWLMRAIVPYYLHEGGLPEMVDLPDDIRGRFGDRKVPPNPPADDYSWDTIRRIRRDWKGRLVIKGISVPEDAITAADIGCDGVIVSNHGGRSLDGCIPSMSALPGVVDAAGSRLDVMVDGGFTRGSDVLKAIALGAKCVWLGRATTFGLVAAGQAGVERVLEIFRSEISRAMAMMGATSVAELNRDFLQL